MPASDYLAIDTETTGTSPWHGCKPFAVSLAWRKEGRITTKWYEWPVDPFTRQPEILYSDLNKLRDILNRFPIWVFHNAKFDLRMLEMIGLFHQSRGITAAMWDRVQDTAIMSHVLDSADDHGLKPLAFKYLDIPEDDETKLGKQVKHLRIQPRIKKFGWNLAKYPDTPGLGKSDSAWKWDYWLPKAVDHKSTLLKEYGVNDAIRTLRLFETFTTALRQEGLLDIYESERKMIPGFYSMETNGLCLDTSHAKKLKATLQAKAENSEAKLNALAASCGIKDFNHRSNKQLPVFLYQTVYTSAGEPLEPVKQGKTAPSCDKDTLIDIWQNQLGNSCNEEGGDREMDHDESCAAEAVDALLTNRMYQTGVNYLDSYINLSLPEKIRLAKKGMYRVLHPSLNQIGARTPRISSSQPNGQNVSTKNDVPLRRIFVPRPGTFWYDIDYANLELRILAYLAGEKKLTDRFDQGLSAMMMIAMELWGIPEERMDGKDKPEYWKYKRTKNFVYARSYGAGPDRADTTLGIPGGTELFGERFPALRKFSEKCIAEARTKGYIETVDGYRVSVPVGTEYTTALNSKIQGTAGRFIKLAMLNFMEQWGAADRGMKLWDIAGDLRRLGVKMLLQVHDELIFEVPNLYRSSIQIPKFLAECMEAPGKQYGIPTPVEVSIVTDNWANPEKLKLETTAA